jgi:putative redox protein
VKNATSKTILSSDRYDAISYAREHELTMNRPFEDGGNNTSATPIEYLLAAIGGCVSMTLRVFANKKGWDLGEITVNVIQKNKLTSSGLSTSLIEEISFEKEITEEQTEELLLIAGKCPVIQLLKKETNIKTVIL